MSIFFLRQASLSTINGRAKLGASFTRYRAEKVGVNARELSPITNEIIDSPFGDIFVLGDESDSISIGRGVGNIVFLGAGKDSVQANVGSWGPKDNIWIDIKGNRLSRVQAFRGAFANGINSAFQYNSTAIFMEDPGGVRERDTVTLVSDNHDVLFGGGRNANSEITFLYDFDATTQSPDADLLKLPGTRSDYRLHIFEDITAPSGSSTLITQLVPTTVILRIPFSFIALTMPVSAMVQPIPVDIGVIHNQTLNGFEGDKFICYNNCRDHL